MAIKEVDKGDTFEEVEDLFDHDDIFEGLESSKD